MRDVENFEEKHAKKKAVIEDKVDALTRILMQRRAGGYRLRGENAG